MRIFRACSEKLNNLSEIFRFCPGWFSG